MESKPVRLVSKLNSLKFQETSTEHFCPRRMNVDAFNDEGEEEWNESTLTWNQMELDPPSDVDSMKQAVVTSFSSELNGF